MVLSPMSTPATRPARMAQNTPTFAPIRNTIRNENIAVSTEADHVPLRSAPSSALISGLSPTLTTNVPKIDAIIPPAATSSGRYHATA